MPLLMSFSLTEPQIVDGSKLVTRRCGWEQLRAGDLVQPVRKRMGLRPGESVVRLRDPMRVRSVRREPIRALLDDLDYGFAEIALEGFGRHPKLRWPRLFVEFFCETHRGCTLNSLVTRIEFEPDLSLARQRRAPAPAAHVGGQRVLEPVTLAVP